MRTWYLSVITIIALFLCTTFRFIESRALKDNSENAVLKSDAGREEMKKEVKKILVYNSTYPITKSEADGDKIVFKIAVISDMDRLSLSSESNTWRSWYKKGTLTWNKNSKNVTIIWDTENRTLQSKYSYSGRGMELSELVTFNGKLLSPDDRTGIVYVLENDNFYPWVVLLDGPGKINKGFKTEWATVKDEHLYIGSSGMEWISNGKIVNYYSMWVKRVSRYGKITNLKWKNNYEALRKELNVTYPGYMWHEAVVWSKIHSKWFFLPRKMSESAYDSKNDEKMGTNKLLSTKDFKDIQVINVSTKVADRGFSSFKFIPNSNDGVIVALKSVEVGTKTETYILAFTTTGETLLEDMKVGDEKYEGFEFI